MNHNTLISFFNIPQPTGIMARWITFLLEFNFEPKYHLGHTNSNIDFLLYLEN